MYMEEKGRKEGRSTVASVYSEGARKVGLELFSDSPKVLCPNRKILLPKLHVLVVSAYGSWSRPVAAPNGLKTW
jgi:hypothetical protein